jgi:TPR repeat protein
MKTLVAILSLIYCLAFAQENGNFLGSNIGMQPQPTPQEIAAQQTREKITVLGGHVLRRVDGKIYNLFQTGQFLGGTMQYIEGDVIIARGYNNTYYAVKNYKGEAIADKDIRPFAMRTGTYNWNGTPLELYDCGQILPPEEEKTEIANIQKTQQDILLQNKLAEQKHQFLIQSNLVARLKVQATNGIVYSQCSLGLHYLKGEGCETNQELAVKWLKIAADNGDLEASNKLEQLTQQK